MEFRQNQNDVNSYRTYFEQMHEEIEQKVNYYKLKKFRPSEFKSIESDLAAVQTMGRIVDNSLMEAPLVLFYT